jgi:oviduct-specific glycoprotein
MNERDLFTGNIQGGSLKDLSFFMTGHLVGADLLLLSNRRFTIPRSARTARACVIIIFPLTSFFAATSSLPGANVRKSVQDMNVMKTVTGVMKAVTGMMKTVTGVMKIVTGVMKAITRMMKTVTGVMKTVTGVMKTVTGVMKAITGVMKAITSILWSILGMSVCYSKIIIN